MTHLKYRADIDGLRAIAILSVVIFHAYPQKLSGGFVGVDVFFVISGFLISTIILKGLADSSFSFYDFYMRRVRRIFPALLLVLVCSFAVGWFTLLADEYSQLGKHIAAGAGFISNLVLANESGYFDNAADTKPLLHLWSLGIEEQFYIFWPLVLWAIFKFKLNIGIVLFIVASLSFGLNLIFLEKSPIYNFYSPITRCWELVSGATLAWYCLHKTQQDHQKATVIHDVQSAFGLILILVGVFLFDKNMPFPGWLAIAPVLGASLLILAGDGAWINRNILASRPMAWFGLISFPLYLWHWPLLSFAHIIEGRLPRSHIRFQLLLLAVLLSWLTFRLIEQPIQRKLDRLNKALILLMGAIGLLGYCTYAFWNGLENRSFPDSVNPNFVKAVNDWGYPKGLKERQFENIKYYINSDSPPEVLVIGDSHVEHFGPRVVALSNDTATKPTAFITAAGLPIPNTCRFSLQDCSEIVDDARKFLANFKSIKTIILGACWNCYFVQDTFSDNGRFHLIDKQRLHFYGGNGKDSALQALRHTLAELSQYGQVYLLLDNPLNDDFDPKKLIHPEGFLNRLSINQTSVSKTAVVSDVVPLHQHQKQLNAELQQIAADAGVEAINQLPILCPDDLCIRLSQDRPVYLDRNHIRPYFVIEKGDYMDRALKN